MQVYLKKSNQLNSWRFFIINYHEILEKVEKLMKEASKIFFDLDPKNNFEMKGRNDYVTEVDFKVQEFLEENLLKLIPGASKMGLNNVNINPKDLAHIEAIILSMTPYERKHPEILKASRKERIAKGSGRNVMEVNRLLTQFEQSKKMVKMISNGNMKLPF